MSETPEDTGLVVVYEASPAVAAQVADLLTKEGIDCVITEKGNPLVSMYSLFHAPPATITVPREQAPWARSYLRKWDDACNANVRKLTKQLGVCFLRSTAITATAAAAIYLAGLFTWNAVIPLVALWAVAFTLLAKLDRVFKSSGKD